MTMLPTVVAGPSLVAELNFAGATRVEVSLPDGVAPPAAAGALAAGIAACEPPPEQAASAATVASATARRARVNERITW